ncbi:MAG: hypothetical protein KBG64_05050 [Clostridia bacterium]|nr:hypothetical protein [Clostridia bacterium]
MILIQDTPHHAGVTICGDQADFSHLYEAIYDMCSKVEVFPIEEPWLIRMLALSYDLRHAMQGDRDMELVESGIETTKENKTSMEDRSYRSLYNFYHKIYILWPEILYELIALERLIKIYAQVIGKNSDYILKQAKSLWDQNIAVARIFQAAVMKEASSLMTPRTFARMQKNLYLSEPLLYDFYDQYIDRLCMEHVQLPAEKRLKNIPAIARKFKDPGDDYLLLKRSIDEYAREHHTYRDNVRFIDDYPVDVDW